MYDTPLSIAQCLAALEGAPARIADAAAGLRPEQLAEPPEPGAWSARDVLAHLRACADVWGGAIGVILSEDRPAFRAVSPRSWVRRTDYLRLAFAPSLQAYAAQRAGLLELLRAQPPEAWERCALVSGAGRARERSALAYAQWIANHERSHLPQLEGAAARWRAE